MAETNAPAIVGGTSDDEFDLMIDGATLPEKVVPLCLDGKLLAEYLAVKDRVDQRANERAAKRAAAAATANDADTRLVSKGPEEPAEDEPDPEQPTLDALAERMRAKAMRFVIRALPSTEYNALLMAHPPRKDPSTGHFDPRDYRGYNSATFPAALVRKSIAQPTMTDERWKKLDAKLNDAQFDRLFIAAADVNRRDEDLPF